MRAAESLIPDEALAMVGRTAGRASGIVVKQDFQRWAAAVKDRNPLYFDEDYAKAQGYRDVVAPPLYLRTVTLGVADLDDLRPDEIFGGSGSGDILLPKCPRRMGGGEDTRFLEPVYDGDVLTAVRRLENVQEKHGRSGVFVLVTWKTTTTRQDGTVVVESERLTIARP